ncbi:D-glycerate 2-kinase (EC [Olavius algarvensis Delta 1 endosymbiont]|nr:D-glycerate 2-kinase (EC [Olavius algarvensis Delta 1 endosymbiont]
MTTWTDQVTTMRRHALQFFQAALKAADPVEAIHRCVKLAGEGIQIGEHRFEFQDFDRILVVGSGKAGAPMAKALEDLLGDRIADGVIVVKEGHGLPLKHVRIHEASHPVPDERGIRGAEDILSLVNEAGARDLVLNVISGGGSALLVAPAEGVALADKQEVTRLLLACGAGIHEINTVRKHLSRAKGGGLARYAYPATVVSLILSDVVGDDLNVIASGPAVPDTSTFADTQEVFRRYDIWQKLPASVQIRIRQGLAGKIEDTPKAGDEVFRRCYSELVGTNIQALMAAGQEARRQGYQSLILSSTVEGEAREVVKMFAAFAKEVRNSANPVAAPACILCGGETTVTIRGSGKGGRNQEFALASALIIDGMPNIVVLSGGTDGTDGPTDAAGAIADGRTIARAGKQNLDPLDFLQRNDSYHFFEPLDDLIITGPTRTNVSDVYMVLVG